jgi:hypothetical protein
MTRWLRLTVAAFLAIAISAGTLSAEEPRTWKMILTTGAKSYDVFRMNTTSGQTWIMDGTKWSLIKDPVAMSVGQPGTYDLHASQLSANDNWTAIRMNVTTGQSWYAADGKWNEITEQ